MPPALLWGGFFSQLTGGWCSGAVGVLLLVATEAGAQSIGVGTATPHPSAALDVSATDKGVLVPRLTQAQRDALPSPAAGLQVFNTTTGRLNIYSDSGWQEVLSSENSEWVTFAYTGGAQSWTVPPGVTRILVEAEGAQGGGYGTPSNGGLGGFVRAELPVTPGETLVIEVGGRRALSLRRLQRRRLR